MHIVLRVLGWLIVFSIVMSVIFGGITKVINTVSENKRKNNDAAHARLMAMKAAAQPTNVVAGPPPKL